MKESNFKKIILTIIIIIFICIIVIGSIIFTRKKHYNEKNKTENENSNLNSDFVVDRNNTVPMEKPKSTIIKENEYNSFSIKGTKEDEIVRLYIKDYIKNCLYFPEEGYELLNEEYRKFKFGNIEEYKKYIDVRREELLKVKIKKYLLNNNEDTSEYIAIDQYGKYYILNVSKNMKYNIMLDNYTVNSKALQKEYDDVDEIKKVGYNIEKFFAAINDKDYKYAYNKLDENFRKNKMPSVDEFKSIMDQTLYSNNNVEHENVEKKGKTYVYDINVKDANNTEDNGKKMTIMMILKQNNDFVMSFSFK